MIRLRALGQLDLDGPGGRGMRGALAQPRRTALLAYLALATPRGHHRRDALLALFWPESDVERARNALNQAVHFLRLSLGSGMIINRNGDDALTLDWDSFWCDAVAFEETLVAGRTAEALELYSGDLLPGFHVSDAPEFERWLDGERARYAGLYAQALEQIAEERERAGDFAGAVTYWKRLASRDPYNSGVALRLMRALAAVGDAAGAIQHARVHTVLLREELELAPNAAVTTLVEQLQSGQSVVPSSRPSPLPPASSPEVSRAPEVVHAAAVPSGLRIAARRRRLTLTLGLVALSAVVAGWAALRGHGGHPGSESNDLSMKLYERGRIEELNRSPLGIEAAKSAYRSAIEHDSTFALGYTGLAGVYGFIADYALGPAAPALDSARIMALRAVALDSLLPEAHTALAVSLGDGGQFAAAEREFLRAIDLGPKNAHAHYWYSIFLVALGRGADALRESERALSLDSIRPRGMLAMQRNAQWLLTGKRPYLQRPVLERRPVLKLDPGEPWARGREAIEFAQERRCAEAQSSIARAQQLAPNNIRTLSFLGQVYWRCGEQARARTLVDEMKKRPDANDHGIRIAVLYALFGEKDSAFVWLDHHRWTLSALAALSADYEEDSLRSDPRFGVLMRRIGIR